MYVIHTGQKFKHINYLWNEVCLNFLLSIFGFFNNIYTHTYISGVPISYSFIQLFEPVFQSHIQINMTLKYIA